MDLAAIGNTLREANIDGVTEYIVRLSSNWADCGRRGDYVAEAEAALMFAGCGFRVSMRDRPDIGLVACGEDVNAEVKRFRFKAQDQQDSVALAAAGNRLVAYGDPSELEGSPSWMQIFDVVCRKAHSLPEGMANLIVIRSASPHCVEELDVMSAGNEVDERLRTSPDCALKRVSGLVLMSMNSHARDGNVFYFPIEHASLRLSSRVDHMVRSIASWCPLG